LLKIYDIMKNLFLAITAIIISSQVMAQDANKKISYVSPNRDTLMLPNNTSGHMVKSMWNDVKKRKRPVIIMTSEEVIAQMNSKRRDD
jgi:hypothetical protein